MSYSIISNTSTTAGNLTLTSSGSTGPFWATTPTYTVTTTGTGLNNDTISNALQVKGDAEILGELKIKGKSLSDQLEKIEERLAILHPNVELESRWEDLKKLRDQYIELEKEIIHKEKMWAILKK